MFFGNFNDSMHRLLDRFAHDFRQRDISTDKIHDLIARINELTQLVSLNSKQKRYFFDATDSLYSDVKGSNYSEDRIANSQEYFLKMEKEILVLNKYLSNQKQSIVLIEKTIEVKKSNGMTVREEEKLSDEIKSQTERVVIPMQRDIDLSLQNLERAKEIHNLVKVIPEFIRSLDDIISILKQLKGHWIRQSVDSTIISTLDPVINLLQNRNATLGSKAHWLELVGFCVSRNTLRDAANVYMYENSEVYPNCMDKELQLIQSSFAAVNR